MMVLDMMITLSLVFDMDIGLFCLGSLVTMLQSGEVNIADVTEEQRFSLSAVARS